MSKCVCSLLYRHYKTFTFILICDFVSWSRCHGIITLSVIDGVPNFFFLQKQLWKFKYYIYFQVLGLQVQKKDMYF